jgi:hypothetical protein
MLIKKRVLDLIKEGKADLAFRRWRKASVKPGTEMHTSVGLLRVRSVEETELSDIDDAAAKRAGYNSQESLVKELSSGREGKIYRIALCYMGPDPRLELRRKGDISGDEWREIAAKLSRLDARASQGEWTRDYLRLIEENEGVRAGDLAAKIGSDKEALKLNVRKLKNLGLTVSLGTGYKLSRRGRAVLEGKKREE